MVTLGSDVKAARRRKGLMAPTQGLGPNVEPRFPVRSLSLSELRREAKSASDGPWRDAVLAELQRRA